jgi:hypothetical protein
MNETTPVATEEKPNVPPKAPEFNYTQTRRIAKLWLGPNARIWARNGVVAIGTEIGNKKEIFVEEKTFTDAVKALAVVVNEAFTQQAAQAKATDGGVIQAK